MTRRISTVLNGRLSRRAALLAGAVLLAAVSVSQRAAAGDPVILAVAEGWDSVNNRPVVVLTGKSIAGLKTFELKRGAILVQTLAPSTSSGSTVVLPLPDNLPAGDYTLGAPPRLAQPYEMHLSAGKVRPASVASAALSGALRTDLDDAATLGGDPIGFYQDAASRDRGTLAIDRCSAIADLIAEGAIGAGSSQAAAGIHDHDARYFLRSELSDPGTFNDLGNPVEWTKLKAVPTNLVSAAGQGLQLAGGSLAIVWPGSGGDLGVASTSARGDHVHDARCFTQTQLNSAGTINLGTNALDWSKLKSVPSGFADGTDDIATPGAGLSLAGSQFALTFAGTGTATTASRSDHEHDTRYVTQSLLSAAGTLNGGTNPVDWTRLKSAPDAFADGADDVGTAGAGLNLVGTQFSVNLGGNGSATTTARSDHNHDATYSGVSHGHDTRYFTQSQLSSSGTINDATNPLDWTRLVGVPAAFADGADSIPTAGTGLSLSGGQFSMNFAGGGSATSVARSDHDHPNTWVLKSGDSMSGPLTVSTGGSPAIDVTSTASSGFGVRATGGPTGIGVYAYATDFYGVNGSIAAYGAGAAAGVYGIAFGPTGVGVFGVSTDGYYSANGGSRGVTGRCQNPNGAAGVWAECTANGPAALVARNTAGSDLAQFRRGGSTYATVQNAGTLTAYAVSSTVSGTATAVTGTTTGSNASAVVGNSSGAVAPTGVRGDGALYGVYGKATGNPNTALDDVTGVVGVGRYAGVYGAPNGLRIDAAGVKGETTSTAGYWGVKARLQSAGGVAALEADCTATGPACLVCNHTGSSGDIAVFQTDSANVARIDRNGVGYFNDGIQGSGADFAESVAVKGDPRVLEPGDVIVVDAGADRRFALCNERESTRLAGVYSTKPAMLGTTHEVAQDDSRLEGEIPLAIVGIVPTKVCDEGGPIARGDLLVSATLPGHAMKAPATPKPGTVLGKALAPLDKGRGTIEVLISVQ